MTVWELIQELTRFEPDDEIAVRADGGDLELEIYDVSYDRVDRMPYIEVRE